MRKERAFMALILMLLWSEVSYSRENRTEIMVDFRVNSVQIDPQYGENAARLDQITGVLHEIMNDTTVETVGLSFCGVASPEGSYEWNRELSKGRLEALERVVRRAIELPDSIVTYDESYIAWDYLAERVSASEMAHKQEILSILGERPEIVKYRNGSSIDSRIPKLQKLDGGKVWQEMLRRFFAPMRNASVVIVTYRHRSSPPEVVSEPLLESVDLPADSVAPPKVVVSPVAKAEEWRGRLYVKTNALGWGLAIANVGVEADLCKHWSFHLPVYYSAWNYSRSTVKFRTLALYPEIRYWFTEKNHSNDGWFVGAHFGLAYYNIATGGEYRTQDHEGQSPALGGGLAAGYRLPISRDKRWKMEFTVGAGVYSLHYDKFRNTPDYRDGLLVSTEKQTWFGIDGASVSFIYTFDLQRKGGVR